MAIAVNEAIDQPRKQFEQAVGQALLHWGDPVWLQDCPLSALSMPAAADINRQLFPQGHALSQLLEGLMNDLVSRLQGSGKVAFLRALFEGLLRGESISAVARQLGRSREHVTRSYWPRAVRLVADELCQPPSPTCGHQPSCRD